MKVILKPTDTVDDGKEYAFTYEFSECIPVVGDIIQFDRIYDYKNGVAHSIKQTMVVVERRFECKKRFDITDEIICVLTLKLK